jgi:5'-nucleotidase
MLLAPPPAPQSIEAGPITAGSIVGALPFKDTMSIVRLNGSTLIAALTHGLTGWGSYGWFPQVAGLRVYHRDGTFLAASLLRGGVEAPLNPATRYTLVTTDLISGGFDGYVVVSKGGQILLSNGMPLDQALMEVVQAAGTISPVTESRIVNCATIKCPATAAQAPFAKVCCA